MTIYRTDDKTIWKMENAEVVWKFTGEQIDEMLDDLKRMENLLTDLVQPEVTAQDVQVEMATCFCCSGSGLHQTYKPNVFVRCTNCNGSGKVPESAADRKEKE